VSCNHNHVRRETHFGELLWVHRKGAMSAADGEPGLIPGSMGTHSFHVEGRGCEDALASSAHGAGRRLSRADARRRLSARDVTRELRGIWFDHRLAQRLREEAPSAYKDVNGVLRAQHALVRIVRTLRPVLSFKGV
jgi:tRNA-splicing ligase RtcB (3'-phosphate/5'-hydroxy nucleic acid ligase)